MHRDRIRHFPSEKIIDLDCSVAYLLSETMAPSSKELGFVSSYSCVSVGLPKTEANWIDVRYDLEKIESLIQVSTHFSFLLF